MAMDFMVAKMLAFEEEHMYVCTLK